MHDRLSVLIVADFMLALWVVPARPVRQCLGRGVTTAGGTRLAGSSGPARRSRARGVLIFP